MKNYNLNGPKSVAKSVKGIRALHEGDIFLVTRYVYTK